MRKEEKKNYEESLKIYNDLHITLSTSERTGYQKGLQELTPLLEEAKAREEEAKTNLKKMIIKMISKGFNVEEIAYDLSKSIAEINEIIAE